MRRALVLGLFALGAVLIAGSLATGVRTAVFVAGAEATQGRVVGVTQRSSGGSASEVASFPVVEYTPGGASRPVRFEGDGGGPTEYRVGDRADVLYDPEAPQDARLSRPAAVWSVPATFAFGALLAFGTGTLLKRILLEEQPGGPDPDDDEP